MKSPRVDSPIILVGIRRIEVESASNNEDLDNPRPLATMRHRSAVLADRGSVGTGLHRRSPSTVYPPSSPLAYKGTGTLPPFHGVSLEPLVPKNQSIAQGHHTLRPAALPLHKKVVLGRSSTLSSDESTKPEEREISLSSTRSSSSSIDGEREGEGVGHLEIDTISSRISVSEGTVSPNNVKTSSALFVRPEPSTRTQGWKCERNFEQSTSTNDMKVWPQILASVVASLAHLALGTVLAYPAIALPLLMANSPAVSSTPAPVDVDFANSSFDILPVTEVFQEASYGSTELTEENDGLSPGFSRLDMNESDSNGTQNVSRRGGFLHAIPITQNQAAWFASVHTFGAVFGSVICGSLLDIAGQRKAMMSIAPILLASWTIIFCATSASLLIVARLLSGVCIGVLGTGAQVYVVEVSHETMRGSLTPITDTFVSCGIVFTYGLGAVGLSWRWTALIIGLSTTVPLVIGLSFLPDSPRWLSMKGRTEDARKALQFLRGRSCSVTNEFEAILKVCANSTQTTAREQIAMLKNPAVYKPFLTSCGVYMLGQFSGPYVIYSYAVEIFQVANVGFSPHFSTVIVGITRLIGSFIGIVVIERAGRRVPMLVGGMGIALSLVVLGSFFYMKDNDPVIASKLGWLPLTSLIVYTIILGASVSPIPFLLATELQPLSFRSMGSSAAKAIFFISGLAVTYGFPTFKRLLGPAITFWIYSASAVALVFFVSFVVPETKGRSLEEIEEYYKNR